MIRTPAPSETYKGMMENISPTDLPEGVFSSCRGGVPYHGGFQRVPGKSIRDTGKSTGGVISIYQFGTKVAVQCFSGLLVFNLKELAPTNLDFIADNEGHEVVDNEGLPLII